MYALVQTCVLHYNNQKLISFDYEKEISMPLTNFLGIL